MSPGSYFTLAGRATVFTRSISPIFSLSFGWVGAALLPKLGMCGCNSAGFGKCAACAGLTSRCSPKRSDYSIYPLYRFGNQHARILRQHARILKQIARILRQHARILKPIARILRQHARILKPIARILRQHARILKPIARILNAGAYFLNCRALSQKKGRNIKNIPAACVGLSSIILTYIEPFQNIHSL